MSQGVCQLFLVLIMIKIRSCQQTKLTLKGPKVGETRLMPIYLNLDSDQDKPDQTSNLDPPQSKAYAIIIRMKKTILTSIEMNLTWIRDSQTLINSMSNLKSLRSADTGWRNHNQKQSRINLR